MIDELPPPTDDDAPDAEGAGHEPHHNLDAEKAALGGMMLSRTGDEIDDVFSVLTPEDFYIPKHETIAEAIRRLHSASKPTDEISVRDELAKTGELTRAGGGEYLSALTGFVPTAANADYYAVLVAEAAVKRRLKIAGIRITAMGDASEGDPTVLVDRARAEVEQITVVRPRALTKLTDGLLELGNSLTEKPNLQSTGWRALDFKIGGFAPGEFYVVAARPGQGKSIFLLNAAMHAARYGVVSFTSLEMKLDQLQIRLMADWGEIHMKSLREHNLTDMDLKSFAIAKNRVAGAGVFVDVTTRATISTIRAQARAVQKRAAAEGKLAMVLVDYIQLVDGPGASRELEVSGVSRELKNMALDMDVIVVAAAQLNRGQPSRNGSVPAPGMRDLRESGGIEQNADGVFLLHRPDKKPHETEVIVAKARQGEVGTVTMRWQPHYARILDPIAQANEPLFEMGMQ